MNKERLLELFEELIDTLNPIKVYQNKVFTINLDVSYNPSELLCEIYDIDKGFIFVRELDKTEKFISKLEVFPISAVKSMTEVTLK